MDDITRESVLAAIQSPKNKRRIIWSAGRTLAIMGIAWYPNVPPQQYRRMKRILRKLSDEGFLVARPELQSWYTQREVAYERPKMLPNS